MEEKDVDQDHQHTVFDKTEESTELTFQLHIEIQKYKKSLKLHSNRLQQMKSCLADANKEKLNLQNKLIAAEQEKDDLLPIIAELQNEKRSLIEEKHDLEIMLGESDAYGKTLQEHVDELEQMGTTLHHQREEQTRYVLQKEIDMKHKYKIQHQAAEDANEQLKKELSHLNANHLETLDELEYIRHEKELLVNEKFEQVKVVTGLKKHIVAIKRDVKIERETAELLSQKNFELSAKLTSVQNELLRAKEHELKGVLPNKELEELMKQNQEIHQQQLDDRDDRIRSLNEKLVESERRVDEERRSRDDTELRCRLLQHEMEKLRKEADMVLSLSAESRRSRQLQAASKSVTMSSMYCNFLTSQEYHQPSSEYGDVGFKPINVTIDEAVGKYEQDVPARSTSSFDSDLARSLELGALSKIQLANEKARCKLSELSIIQDDNSDVP